MKAQARRLSTAVLAVALLTASCSVLSQLPADKPGTIPASGGQPTTTAPDGQIVTAANSSGPQAPICSATVSCAALNAEQIMLSCVKKVPYTNVLVPRGTTFEVVDKSGDFTCIDSGTVVHDKQVLTCHGKELYSFQLKLSNPACAARLLGRTGNCDSGYGYDESQNCCAPLSGDATGSTIVTVDLGACPEPKP